MPYMDLIGENLLASLSLRTKTSYYEYLRYLSAAAKCVFVLLMFVGANVCTTGLVNLYTDLPKVIVLSVVEKCIFNHVGLIIFKTQSSWSALWW